MLYQKLQENSISQGCTTFSKRPDQYVFNHPTHILDSHGPKILGSDNNWYVDMVCGLGSNLTEIKNNFCKASIYEPLLAEAIKKKIRFIQKVKFLKTGSAACEAAVRFARAYTGKKVVLGTGYHGCCNWSIAAEKPGLGTVDEGYVKFDKLEDLMLFIKRSHELQNASTLDIAAVIVEPVQLDISESRQKQLIELRKICTSYGIVLIFDEIITGWRVPYFCISQWWGIKPDLICFGKALGNGYPIAVLAGPSKILDMDGVFISNTHNGEQSALQEALKTIQLVTRYDLDRFWNRAGMFKKQVNKLLPADKLQLVGYNTRGEWVGDEEYKTVFFERMAFYKVILGKAWFVTTSHTVRVYRDVLVAVQKSLEDISRGAVRKGYICTPIFRRN
jgi:glutamate-1-semialdehyde aminotransferase